MPERNQIVDSPAVLLEEAGHQRKILFSSGEKEIRRAQIRNCEENFFTGWRGFRATAGLASLLGVLLKKSSNINQKTPPITISAFLNRYQGLKYQQIYSRQLRLFEGKIPHQLAVG